MSDAKERTDAAERFRKAFNETTACITSAPVELIPRGKRDRLLRLTCQLRSRAGDAYRLTLEQEFTTARHPEHGMKARSLSYAYSLSTQGEEDFEEMLSYQWHPKIGVTWPHLHLFKPAFGPDGVPFAIADKPFERLHLPTGRVTIERLVGLLLDGFDVPAIVPHDEWKLTLDRNEALFEKYKTW